MQGTNWKRNAGVFIGSQSISLFGSALVQFAITWYITLTTQSGIYMTISIACSLLPLLFVSPFAGVWADRYDRKKLIVISDGTIAVSTLLLAIVYLLGYKPLWLLYAVTVIRSVGGAVQSPSINALIPSMVPEDQLTRINGINSSMQSMLQLVAPALAGAILTAVGSIEIVLFIDVVTAAIAIMIMLRFLKIPQTERHASAKASYLVEIREGLRYIGRHGYLKHLLCYVFLICFLIAPVAFLTPLQVVRSYGTETWKMTASQMAYTGGMMAGGLLISVWAGLKNRNHTMGFSIILMGLSTVALGLGLPFWLYLSLTVIIGITMPFFNTPAVVMLQERVDTVYIGRVFSVISMVNGAMMPLGMMLFGPLSDTVSIELLLILTGIAIILGALVLLMDKTLRAVGIPNRKPEINSQDVGVRTDF